MPLLSLASMLFALLALLLEAPPSLAQQLPCDPTQSLCVPLPPPGPGPGSMFPVVPDG